MKKTRGTKHLSEADTLLERVTSSWIAQAVYVAAELRLADLLAKGPRSSEDLAAATDTHASSLKRLLRALTTIGICQERKDGLFQITPMGKLLGTGTPGSLRSYIIWWGTNLWETWGNLLHSVKTGESARKLLRGTTGFDHLKNDPRATAVFNQAMAEITRLSTASVIRAYDFSGFKRILDVGGGYGEFLAEILKNNPSVSGILFDLPPAIEGAKRYFQKARLTQRCQFTAGDFFKSVPRGADACVLKSVIHDWNDKDSETILKNCRCALKKGGRLILVERVIPKRLGTSAAHQALARGDLTMLVALAAQERTEMEFRKLLKSAGFKIRRIVPTDSTFNIIEACPV